MTALAFINTPEYVLIGNDTLSLHGENKEPILFVSKTYSLPHLKSTVSCVGSYNLMTKWLLFIMERVKGRDIDSLNMFASAKLTELSENNDLNIKLNGTIFHFGFSEKRNRYEGYVFSSYRNFQQEELDYGMALRPSNKEILDNTINNPELYNNPESVFIDVITKLKQVDDNLPLQERVGIGGEIQYTILQNKQVASAIIHQFDDLEDSFKSMVYNKE